MQLCQKRKLFSEFLFPFCKFRFSFENFQKTDDPHSYCIFEHGYSERRG